MECCQPELTVGDTWGGSFYLGPAEPSWSKYATVPLTAAVRELGVVAFDGDVLRPARKVTDAAFVSLGTASVGVIADRDWPQPSGHSAGAHSRRS